MPHKRKRDRQDDREERGRKRRQLQTIIDKQRRGDTLSAEEREQREKLITEELSRGSLPRDAVRILEKCKNGEQLQPWKYRQLWISISGEI